MPHSPPNSRFLVPSLVAHAAQAGAATASAATHAPVEGEQAHAEEGSGVRPTGSQVQRAEAARGVVAQLDEEARSLVRGLEALRFALQSRTGPEGRRLKGQAQALAHVRDGFTQALGAARHVPRLFHGDSVFVEYLRGLAAWAHATLEAIDDRARARETERGSRVRVELAKSLHFDELADEVERELAAEGAYDPAIDPVREAMGRLFFVARALEQQL